MTPLVHVILVNWNGFDDTLACVESCLGMTYPNFRIAVVDNGSADGSGRRLEEHFTDDDRVRVLRNAQNLGFAGGNNTGIAEAAESGAEYVWLLNNDTTVEPDALSQLVDAAEQHPEAGMLGSKIRYYSQPDTLWFAGGSISHARGGGVSHRGFNERDTGQYDLTETVDYVTGCSLFTSMATVAAIGPMAEDYFLYWEEVDWCARAVEAGYTCLYVPGSVVYHKVGASFGAMSAVQARYEMRNRLLFYKRHHPGLLRQVLLYALRSAASNVMHGKVREGLTLLHAIADFARGRRGPIHRG